MVVQSKENDPNIMYEQFRKRGATEFYGTENVMKANEWLEHIEDVFSKLSALKSKEFCLPLPC